MHNFTWYVAAPWVDRPNVRIIIEKLQANGWNTNSRWAAIDNEDVSKDDPERDEKLRWQATRDVEDVVKADGLIYVNSAISEGKATELGISIAMLKPVIIIGERSYPDRFNNNIFLNLNIPAYPTVEEAMAWLEDEGHNYLNYVMSKQYEFIQKTQGMMDEFIEATPVEYPSE